MKILSLILAAGLFFSSSSVLAQNNAGHVFGSGVSCTFSDGSVKHLPRELCKMYGGEHK
ncbi:hypothetical protein VroAM7_07810 [Vibrio rotiferianus]|uniref:Uncharacterized protein n=1 Tax=Vibrio rotiferianus TaxID=190895 RepID=A0A510I4G5_9VIBR|nr:hypothetical protein VroAM7_07810 [Vibrio rotiferianus]